MLRLVELPTVFTRRILLAAWNPSRVFGMRWADLVHAAIIDLFRRSE